MSKRILIADRGEIAIRIARTLIENGYIPVGIYVADDVDSLHRKFLAEDVEVSNYLDIKEVINAALELGAEAVHPGYGFLSENPEFAREVIRKGLVFVGPSPNVMALSGDKLASKIYAEKLEVPTLPWAEVHRPEDVAEFAKVHGYPVIVKAASGSGYRGIRVIWGEKEVEFSVKSAKAEAEKAFKDPRLYVEPYLEYAKHIDVQILGDGDNIIHLYERECSVQRKFQRLVDEAPSPSLTATEKERLYEYALTLARGLRYVSAGTVEFIFDVKKRELYFTEISAGLQAGHPITEMITRVDIVKKQIEVALYSVLGLKQSDLKPEGHAIGVHVYAENPYTGEPFSGTIRRYKEPNGPGIRVDSGVTEGSRINEKYGLLVAKVVAWGPDRYSSIQRLERALGEYIIEGISTSIPLLRQIIKTPEFVNANYTMSYLDKELSNMYSKILEDAKVHAVILSALLEYNDPGAKVYSRKESLIEHVLKSERVSSIKRHAWYYYINLKTSLERYYSGRRSRAREERSKRK